MTRINIIPPGDLYDQHLIAEYREMLMVPASLKRTLASKLGLQLNKIPKRFTLNTGHVYFFYDKGLYLDKRYQSLIDEMILRGFNPDSSRVFPTEIFKENNLYNDWTPSRKEQLLIKQRITERVNQRPGWYRKTK